MKHTQIFQAIAILATAFAATLANAASLEETTTKTIPRDELSHISVSNVNGSIFFEKWDQSEIEVEYTIKAKGKNKENVEQFIEKVSVDFLQKGDSLTVKTKLPRNKKGGFWGWLLRSNNSVSVSYKVQVPSNLNVSVSSVNGGITLNEIDGVVKANTVNGGIRGVNLRSVKKMETVNGAINCSIYGEIPESGTRFSTVNGGVKVHIPNETACNVNVSTVNGGIKCNLPLSDIDVKKKRKLKALANGGGPELNISSVNGGVSISSR